MFVHVTGSSRRTRWPTSKRASQKGMAEKAPKRRTRAIGKEMSRARAKEVEKGTNVLTTKVAQNKEASMREVANRVSCICPMRPRLVYHAVRFRQGRRGQSTANRERKSHGQRGGAGTPRLAQNHDGQSRQSGSVIRDMGRRQKKNNTYTHIVGHALELPLCCT